MFFGYGFDPTIIILIPAMLFAFYAQAKVKSTFSRYSDVRTQNGLTGAQAARYVLDANGLNDVVINQISGDLTDHYDPRDRSLNLSQTVCNVPTIAAVSVACHEAGHAIQHSRGYIPLKVRNSIVPVVNLASSLSWIMIMIGLGIIFTQSSSYMGNMLFNIGVLAFIVVFAFHLITLPVEFNASSRALKHMEAMNLVAPEDMRGARRVLSAAAMTYVAAVAVSAANLIRILLIRGSRD